MKMPSLAVERLTLAEASWLHRHRHLDISKEIVVLHNLLKANPLEPTVRIGWNKRIREWRASEQHPDWRY